MTSVPVIETSYLRKTYGKIEAVCGVNLSVQPHAITAFLGLNGAGKSTTIKMLLGMIRPSGGDGKVLGLNITEPMQSLEMRRKVAYVSETKQLYDYMTVQQMIDFTRSFYADWRPEVALKLLRDYNLPLDRKIKALSKGMRTKLALLLAFSRRPEVMILDEPSEGLDPIGIEQMLESLVALCAEGTTVFFSSHQISEVERVADNVCMIHQGRIVINAAIDDMRGSYRQIDLTFATIPTVSEFSLPGVERVRIDGRQVRLFTSRNADAVVKRAHELNASAVDVSAVGLREIFLETAQEH